MPTLAVDTSGMGHVTVEPVAPVISSGDPVSTFVGAAEPVAESMAVSAYQEVAAGGNRSPVTSVADTAVPVASAVASTVEPDVPVVNRTVSVVEPVTPAVEVTPPVVETRAPTAPLSVSSVPTSVTSTPSPRGAAPRCRVAKSIFKSYPHLSFHS